MRENKGSCIAIGNFDGIHVGHNILIRKMIDLSTENNLDSIIITFEYVKNDLRKSSSNMKYINSPSRKLKILKSYKVSRVVEIQLNDVISKYTPEEFIKLLVYEYNAKNIVVGYNFRFGHKASGNISTLMNFQDKYGYKVEEIYPVKHQGIAISSTLVRNLLKEGKIREANKLLVNKYTLYHEELNFDYNKNMAFVDNKSSILVPSDGKYLVNIGSKELILTITSNEKGASLIFNNKLEENADIVFVDKLSKQTNF
ncbi:MAG: FAD synthetase family protein [Tissierellia bacterium]|nr:FAD synthetase family protein [Tissierellia bacterium]